MGCARRWQFSLATLLGALTTCSILFAVWQPEVPPRPVQPETEAERRVMMLTRKFRGKYDLRERWIPILIKPLPDKENHFVVIYWTPRREFQLLGNRAVIVDVEKEVVEFVMRD